MRRTRTMGKPNGRHLVICELSGFQCWSDEVRETWDGKIVHKDFWEPRHPQDFVRGKADKQSVSPSRPPTADVFITRCTADGVDGVAGYATAGCSIAGIRITR